MGAVDPEGNLRKLNWEDPNEGLKENEIGLTEEKFKLLEAVKKEQRAKVYSEMRAAAKRPRSCLPKSLRK
jgi:hypothetical protein